MAAKKFLAISSISADPDARDECVAVPAPEQGDDLQTLVLGA
jgi:hypothetical protein